MYSYGTSYGGSSGLDVLLPITILLCMGYLVAWIISMFIVVDAAKDKGYPHISIRLWLIGLFGFIFTPAIIVAALPDKTLRAGKQDDPKFQNINDELPPI